MGTDNQPGFSNAGFNNEESRCNYCGGQITATSPLCLICGMPRRQAEVPDILRISTPSPRLMSVQKAYDPNVQHYSSVEVDPHVPPPPPVFEEPTFGSAMTLGNIQKRTRYDRAIATLLAIGAVGAVLFLCTYSAWHSRTELTANVAQVRNELHDWVRPFKNFSPNYTATPMNRFHLAKPSEAAQSSEAQLAPSPSGRAMEVRILQTSPAPPPTVPGKVHIRIAPRALTSNSSPVSM
jgi:hypothetical protein